MMSCSSSDPPSHCSAASPELKLYQTFIFSVPVFFTFILLFLFYFFYLRRRRANWQSLRMRASYLSGGDAPRVRVVDVHFHNVLLNFHLFIYLFICEWKYRSRSQASRRKSGKCFRLLCSKKAS